MDNQFIVTQFNNAKMMEFNFMQSKSSKICYNILTVKSSLKLSFIICLMLTNIGVFAQAPSDIPKFQDFLAHCKLQAPGSNTAASNTVLNNGYTHGTWFHVVDGDKILFNQTGDSNRTELRDEINWNLNTEDRSLHATIDIVQQTVDNDQVTVLQIHDDANAGSGPNKPLLRIYKHNNKTPNNHLWAVYKTDITGGNNSHIDLGPDPGGYFSCDIRLVNGNMIIDFDGVEKVNVDVSYWTFPSYWKAGVYLQDPGTATAYFDELFTGNGTALTTPELEIETTKIYPNPFYDKVNIETKSHIQSLVLTNLLGKVVYKSTMVSDFESFSGTLQSGVYILKLVDEGKKAFTMKLIKK